MAAKIVAVVALASLSAAEPGYGHGYGINAVAYHPYGGYSSEYRTTQGLTGYGKREAEPGYGYGGQSYVYRTTEGLTGGYGGYHKRSAEPGYGYTSGVSYYHRSPQGVQGYGGYRKRSAGHSHGHGHSYVHQDREPYHGSYGYEIDHDYKKRSAEAGYGTTGESYQYVSRPYSDYKIKVYHPETYHHGYGKRSAQPGYGYGSASVHVEQSDHGYNPASYEYGYNIHKRSAEPGYGYGSASVHVEQLDHGYGYNLASYEYGYNIHKRSADAGYESNESYQDVSNTPYSHYEINVHHPY